MRIELGSSDRLVVLNDADLWNFGGESGVADVIPQNYRTGLCVAKRFIIREREFTSAFTRRFVAAAAALKMGDPA